MKKFSLIVLSLIAILSFLPDESFAYNGGLMEGKPWYYGKSDNNISVTAITDNNLSTSFYFPDTRDGSSIWFNFQSPVDIGTVYVKMASPLTFTFHKSDGSFVNKDLLNGTYTINIKAVTKISASFYGGGGRTIYEFDAYELPDTSPPLTPTGLRAVGGVMAIDLVWNPNNQSGITGYNIYRNDVKLNSQPITATSYRDTDVVPDQYYSYSVSALKSGQESSKSQAVQAFAMTEEHIPVLELLSRTDTSFNLKWTKLSGGSTEIYLNGSLIDTTIYDFFTITNLSPATSYEIYVIYIDKYNRRNQSNVLHVNTETPSLSKPVVFVDSKTYNSIKVYWQSVKYASNYTIFFNGVERETINDTSYSFTNLNPNTDYKITVRANGLEHYSETTISVRTDPFPVPSITSAKLSPVDGQPFKRTLSYTHVNGVTGVRLFIDGKLIGTFPVSQSEIPVDLSEYSSKPVVKLRLEPIDENGKGFDVTTPVQPTDSTADDFLGYLLEIFDIIIRGFLIIAIASIPLLVVVIAFFWFRRKLKKEVHGATGPTGKDTALLSNTSGKFNALEIPDSSNMMKYLHGRKQKLREQSNYQDRGFRIHERKVSYRNVGLFGVKKHVDVTYERDGVLYKRRYIRGKGQVFVPKDFANRRKHIQNQFRSIASVFSGVKRSGKKA